MTLSEGEISGYKGAALLLLVLPDTQQFVADRSFDADWYQLRYLTETSRPAIDLEGTE